MYCKFKKPPYPNYWQLGGDFLSFPFIREAWVVILCIPMYNSAKKLQYTFNNWAKSFTFLLEFCFFPTGILMTSPIKFLFPLTLHIHMLIWKYLENSKFIFCCESIYIPKMILNNKKITWLFGPIKYSLYCTVCIFNKH